MRAKGSSGFVTIGVLVAMAVTSVALFTGAGNRDARSAVEDGVTWLFSRDGRHNRLTRANGASGQADKRTFFPGSGDVELIQRNGITLVRSGSTVRRLDDDLSVVEASTSVPASRRLVIGDGVVYVVDGKRGKVWAGDPDTLDKIGHTVSLPKRLSSAVFGLDRRLWVASPTTGEALGVDGGAGAGASLSKRLKVGSAGPTEMLLQDGLPVVLSASAHRLVPIRNGKLGTPVPLPADMGTSDLVVAEAAQGGVVPVLDRSNHRIYVATPAGPITIGLPGGGDGTRFGPPVGYAGRIYVPDYEGGSLLVYSAEGEQTDTLAVPGAKGSSKFELRLDAGYLWANDPGSHEALVLGPDGKPRKIDKFDPKAKGPAPTTKPKQQPGSKTSPLPPPSSGRGGTSAPQGPGGNGPTPVLDGGGSTTTTTPSVAPPAPTVPPAPTTTTAAGNKSVTVSWQLPSDGGSSIVEYEVAWTAKDVPPETYSAGKGELTHLVESLRNGVTYSFTVRARNGVGWGPKSAPSEAKPSNKVPDAPASVTAAQTADDDDGSVLVSWDEADGQGYDISGYSVYAIDVSSSDVPTGSPAPTDRLVLVSGGVDPGACSGGSCSTRVGVQPGAWLGAHQRFAMTADSSSGTTSTPSNPSNAVVPATPPGDLQTPQLASESSDGLTLTLTTSASSDGGHDLGGVGVTVDGGDQGEQPASVCATAADRSVSCSVTVTVPDRSTSHTIGLHLVTDMGSGGEATASIGAKAPPSASISASAPGYNTTHVQWSSGGDGTSCRVTGPNLDTTNCSGSTDIGGVGAGTATYTITVTSPYYGPASQSASASVSNPPAREARCTAPKPCRNNQRSNFTAGLDGPTIPRNTTVSVICQLNGAPVGGTQYKVNWNGGQYYVIASDFAASGGPFPAC